MITVRCAYKGIGDHILCQLLCAGFRARGERVRLHAHNRDVAAWTALVDGAHEITVGPTPQGALEPCRMTFRHGGRLVPWWADMEERCGVQAVLPLPRPLKPEFNAVVGPGMQTIVLCPSTGPGSNLKRWPQQHWLDLETLLLNAGEKTVVLSDEDGPWSGHKLIGESAQRVAGVIASAACIVTGDTGLAHLAGCFRRPTLVLNAMYPGDVLFRLYPTVRAHQGPLSCGPCYFAEEQRQRAGCSSHCLNLAAITPDAVFRRVAPMKDTDLCLHATLRRMVPAWQPRSYLEIGVREGDSLRLVLAGAPSLERLVLADNWSATYGGSGRGNHEHIAAMLPQDLQVRFLDGDSQHTLPTLSEQFDLITVDGDHSADSAAADLEQAARLIAPGGRIVFDDVVHPGHGYLRGVAEKFAKSHPELCVEHANYWQPHGVVVLRRQGG